MKEAFTRLLIAAAMALVHAVAFDIRYSLWTFIALWAFWTVPLQTILIIQNIIHNHRLKLEDAATTELPLPDTQPLNKT